ncbi:DUF6703 family protein [Leucobacter sp. NPDC015123]|uniref:DUF6703 family protein n=1 Tax=Leucobacter sp. NPDC015123 TaxID=3364129 RepID=UPI0036F46DC4
MTEFLQRCRREAKSARRMMWFNIVMVGLNLIAGIGLYATGRVGIVNLLLAALMAWMAFVTRLAAQRWERAAAAAR